MIEENARKVRNFIEKYIDIDKYKQLYSLEENIFHRGVYGNLDELYKQLHGLFLVSRFSLKVKKF